MITQKNRVLVWVSMYVVIFSLLAQIIHLVHHDVAVLGISVFVISGLCMGGALYFYRNNPEHSQLPLLIALAIGTASSSVLAIILSDSIGLFIFAALVMLGASYVVVRQIVTGQVISQEQLDKNRRLGEIVSKLSKTSDHLVASSEELSMNAQHNQDITRDITKGLHEVAEGVQSQMQQTAQNSKVIEEMSIAINRIAETSSVVSETSIDTAKKAKTGNDTIKKTMEQMNFINNTVNDTASGIKALEQRSDEIGEIVGLITSIANQTNLLALNAAIEAARAGEHGKGFAVVAGEVKKLAEQSANSANQISTLIQAIQQDTVQSVESMNKVTHEMQAGINVVKEAGEAFEHILRAAETVADQIQEISAVSEQISAGVEEASASMHEMTRYAEISTEKSHKVVQICDNNAGTMDKTNDLIVSLRQTANEIGELTQMIKSFKV